MSGFASISSSLLQIPDLLSEPQFLWHFKQIMSWNIPKTIIKEELSDVQSLVLIIQVKKRCPLTAIPFFSDAPIQGNEKPQRVLQYMCIKCPCSHMLTEQYPLLIFKGKGIVGYKK